MDCVDHPQELVGWNPYAALADLVEAGAIVRTPLVVQSCSRLTLGANGGLLTNADESRIGDNIMKRLHHLHRWRMLEVNELLVRWAGKFPQKSTCPTCDVDLWEMFLLTTVIAMLKEGSLYIDKESASDTSSEEGSEGVAEHRMDMDSDDDERDEHLGQDSASEPDDDDRLGMDERNLDPLLLPLDDGAEPSRPPTSGLRLQQRMMRNYGPNQYILRILCMDSFSCGDARRNSRFKVCPRCGWRFDGQELHTASPAYRMLERAFEVARREVAGLCEVIDLPPAL